MAAAHPGPARINREQVAKDMEQGSTYVQVLARQPKVTKRLPH
jgi:hypothetical protein